MQTEKPFLTVSEVAELFLVSDRTVIDWIGNGKLRSVKVGRSHLISAQDVDALIGEVSSLTPKVQDAVYQNARLNHVHRLSKSAKELEKQLSIPRPLDAGSWVPPQGREYGVSAILTGSHPVTSKLGYEWIARAKTPGTFKFAVEQDLYFPSLQAHVADGYIWEQYSELQKDAAEYLFSCRIFLSKIIAECERIICSRVMIEGQWSQEGIFWNFAERVYTHYTSIAMGFGGWSNDSSYKYGRSSSKVPAQGEIFTLAHGGAGIACHRNKRSLEVWKKLHKGLITDIRDDWNMGAAMLVKKHQQLATAAAPIKKVLLMEVERGTFDRGRCHLCP